MEITNFEIRENDQWLEFALQETKSPKIAGILKQIQCLKTGKDRVIAIKLIKLTLGVK